MAALNGDAKGQADPAIPKPAPGPCVGRAGSLAGRHRVRGGTDGKNRRSRRRFVHPHAPVISLHKPHPGNIVKTYVVGEVLRLLTEERLI